MANYKKRKDKRKRVVCQMCKPHKHFNKYARFDSPQIKRFKDRVDEGYREAS